MPETSDEKCAHCANMIPSSYKDEGALCSHGRMCESCTRAAVYGAFSVPSYRDAPAQ
jgi:hypothetical protein